MHKYLSAIGFKHIDSRKALNKLIDFTESSFQYEKTVKVKDQLEVSERIKHFTKDMGLIVVGAYDKDDNYEREHYIPFFLGKERRNLMNLQLSVILQEILMQVPVSILGLELPLSTICRMQ